MSFDFSFVVLILGTYPTLAGNPLSGRADGHAQRLDRSKSSHKSAAPRGRAIRVCALRVMGVVIAVDFQMESRFLCLIGWGAILRWSIALGFWAVRVEVRLCCATYEA